MIESQFIEYVVKQLVDHPDAVKVERAEDERGVLLNLSVDPEDLGRVIGKHGATAQSLRALLRALGTKNNDHYNLKIIDTDGEKDDAPESEDVKTTTENSRNSDEKTPVVENSNSESTSETVEKAKDDVSERAQKLREDLAKYDDLDI